MVAKQEKLREELAEKYGVPEDELSGIVDSFFRDTYGPAIELAEAIKSKERPVLLFIGRKDCNICQRSLPALERFLHNHKELELVKLDYSDAQGLIYHMIQQQDRGMLPMIAMIFRGSICMLFTGEGIHEEIYEKYFNKLRSECSQNIYVH
ncbi:MAG: hypothetical protein GYA39_04345 [Methanothrix sp.]|nr:hypothetical protein [Methanothrix sp.]